jgi:hypothetical protein
VSLVALLILGCTMAFPAGKTSLFPARGLFVGRRDVGVIFSTENILLDLQSYQGGLGVKIGLEKSTLRLDADVLLSTGLNPFSLTAGVVWEMHVLPGPVSLYWGPSARMGFTILTNKIDSDNWTQEIAWEVLSAGVVGGIELFIFDFLSVFAEYALVFNLSMNFDRVSVAGSVSSTSELAYNLDLGMGNKAMLGFVIYLVRKKR